MNQAHSRQIVHWVHEVTIKGRQLPGISPGAWGPRPTWCATRSTAIPQPRSSRRPQVRSRSFSTMSPASSG